MDVGDSTDVLVVRRTMPFARERVFAAWLDPGSLAQWMCPGSTRSALAEVDPRVGGRFRIVMNHADGAYEHWGEYLTIEPPSRLVFTWISASTNLRPTTVDVEFLDRGGATELILTHRRLPQPQLGPHRSGWSDIVAKLEAVLAR